MSESHLNNALVRILINAQEREKSPVGAGFFISPHYILTCAHVIASALKIHRETIEPPTQPIFLDFPLLAKPHGPLSATVHKWYPVKEMTSMDELGDIAVLKLTSEVLPEKAQPVLMMIIDDHAFRERAVLMCGFPKNMDHGDWLNGQLKGLIGNGLVQLETEIGRRNIAPGFSGTAVWDEKENAVVGMMVRITKRDGDTPAYMIPIAKLFQAWPELDKYNRFRSPYLGLEAFHEQDADYFFGRETIINNLQQAVQKNPFVAVIGASGSGKSSLVFAGLVPLLCNRETHEDKWRWLSKGNEWLVVKCRPSTQPLRELAKALEPLLNNSKSADDLFKELEQDEKSLVFYYEISRILNKHPHKRLLLIVDQFEELYTQNPDKTLQRRFVDSLLQVVQSQDRLPEFTLLITLRADFMEQALGHDSFAYVLNQFHTEMLGPMSETELKTAIEAPAKKLGITLELGLTSLILKELGNEPGNLPLLEFALEQLWHRRTYSHLTHQAYEEIGGVKQALARYAESVYQQFEKTGQEKILRQILVQLVHPGENAVDIRKVATCEQVGGEENWHLITKLANDRLVVTGRDEAGKETVELVHEALIQHWGLLKRWVNEDRVFRVWQEELRRTIRYWKEQNQNEGALLQGTKLAEAEERLKKYDNRLGDIEKTFISESMALREREDEAREYARQVRERLQRVSNQRLKLTIVVLILLIAAITLGWWETLQQEKKTLHNQSLAVAEIAKQEIASGNAVNGILYSLEVLPRDILHPNRPYVPEARVQLYDALVHQRERRILAGHQDYIGGVAVSPNGQYIVTASKDGTARLWEVNSGRLLKIFDEHTGEVVYATFSPDSQWVITASTDKTAHLWDVNSRKLIHIFKGHTGVITCAKFSPDGQLLVTTSEDKSARLWDVKTGQPLYNDLKGHKGIVRNATFSPEGRFVVTTSDDHTARLWETKSGKLIHELTGHQGKVWNAAFHPKGQRLVTVSEDKTARMWNVNSGKSVYTLNQHENLVFHATFSPDGQYIATASYDNLARIWEANSGKLIHKLKGHDYYVNRVVFSPNGQQLVTTSWDNTARLWEVSSGELLYVLRGHQDQIQDVAFDPSGQYLVTVSYDKTARLWEITKSNQLVKVLEGHQGPVPHAIFSRNNQYLATASWDKTARLWEVSSGQLLHVLEGHQGSLEKINFSPDDQYLVTASKDKTARVWEVKNGKLVHILEGHEDKVSHVTFSPDGKYIVTTSFDKQVRLWESKSGKLLHTLSRHKYQVNYAAFSPDSQLLATVEGDENQEPTTYLWDVKLGEFQNKFSSHGNGVSYVAFSPNGQYLITAEDKTANLWNVKSGDFLYVLKGHGSFINYIDFSQDGLLVATASDDNTARLWEVKSGKLLHILIGHEHFVSSAQFSSDGQHLLTSSFDGTARLWDVKTGKTVSLFKGHEGYIFHTTFSPDERYVVTASKDGTARLWTIFPSTQALIDYARKNVPRQLTSEQREQYFEATEQSNLFFLK